MCVCEELPYHIDRPPTSLLILWFCFGDGFITTTTVAVACIVYVPVDVIKERLQIQQYYGSQPTTTTMNARMDHGMYYKNGSDALYKILRQEGFYGLYLGYGATLASK